MVINLDRSVKRLERMQEAFIGLGLPEFERRPGVEAAEGVSYEVPRLGKVPIADYGCALAHRRTWQAVADGPHEWVVVLEDDAPPVSYSAVTNFPPVPAQCDYVQLYTKSSFSYRTVCSGQQRGVRKVRHTPHIHARILMVLRQIRKGFGLFGYLLNRDGARRMVEASAGGFDVPADLFVIRHNTVWHHTCLCCMMMSYWHAAMYHAREPGQSALPQAH